MEKKNYITIVRSPYGASGTEVRLTDEVAERLLASGVVRMIEDLEETQEIDVIVLSDYGEDESDE